MKRKYWLLVVVVGLLTGWIFRFELVSWFQYRKLRSFKCRNENKSNECLRKLWVHRVNSIERLMLLRNRFDGFEADVVFDSALNSFFVYHPPSKNINLKLKLFLQTALAQKKKLWLDTRGVDSLSMLKAFETLKDLDKHGDIKPQVIFEFYDLRAANYFAQRGYNVSLNIGTTKLDQNKEIENMRLQLSPQVQFVSQQSEYVDRLKKAFPGKKILTWSLSFANYFQSAELEKLLNDDQVAIVLVNFKSRNYY